MKPTELFNGILRDYAESISRVNRLHAEPPMRKPPTKGPTYDVKCGDLADQFLQDTPELNTDDNARDLARTIQIAIEE
jgi:hypothetical protein